MRMDARWIAALILTTLLMAACTRDRPTPEPLETAALPEAPVTADLVTPSPDAAAPDAGDETETDDEGGSQEPSVEVTPTVEAPEEETFIYQVEEGDTLLSIALAFSTDVETLRTLNNLFDDNIRVGQPLSVPVVEGVVIPGQPTPTPGPFYYTVQSGDTLGGIALRFGTEPLRIIEANNLLDPDNLNAGTRLLIPDYTPSTEDVADGSDAGSAGGAGSTAGADQSAAHVVQVGETLSTIAETYGVDAAEIARANNITNFNLLRVGQELIIPGVTQREAQVRRGATHIVQSGESLSEIAAQYGVSVESIIAFNGIENADAIFVGQELLIPEE